MMMMMIMTVTLKIIIMILIIIKMMRNLILNNYIQETCFYFLHCMFHCFFLSSFHCICCTYHGHILQICLFCLIVRKISDHVQCQKTLMIHFDTLVGSKILLM